MEVHSILVLHGSVVMQDLQEPLSCVGLRSDVRVGRYRRLEGRDPEKFLPPCSEEVIQGRLVRFVAIEATDPRERAVADDVLDIGGVVELVVSFPRPG